jgi:diguanylate cyclase (GGDEF)-like protein
MSHEPESVDHRDEPAAGPGGPMTKIDDRSQHPGRDAPRRKQLEYWLGHFAQFDLLTDLPNRSQFLDRLTGAIARAARSNRLLGVALLNLDHFKRVNATYGLQTGDLVLKRMAERLKGCTRASDSIARLGGDEFSVLLEGLIEPEGAAIAVQRVQGALSKPLSISGREVVITATVGVAFYPPDGADVDTILRHADVAMCYAKEQRRGSYQFHSADLALSTVATMRAAPRSSSGLRASRRASAKCSTFSSPATPTR